MCAPNERQPSWFCDVDVDCWGDADYCHMFNPVCPEQKECCVVQPTHREYTPPLPPAAPTPIVPICPVNTHLCAANGRQPRAFCDVDPDCYGDSEYCFGSNVTNGCPEKKGCCVQQPTEGPQPHGWVPPQAGDPQLSPAVCERLLRDPGHLFRRRAASPQSNEHQCAQDAR